MDVTVRHLGAVQFEVTARGHRLLCDQPIENKGSDSGMTPPELLLASLATCAAYYAVEYLKARSLSTEGLEVRVSAEKASSPARLASFRVEVVVPGLDEDRHKAGVTRAVHACLIHNTLLNLPKVELEVQAGVPAVV